jgi:hypothetical protein
MWYKFLGDKKIYGLWKAIIFLIVEIIFKPRWIVNKDNELGFSIRGIQFYYYKWDTPIVAFFSKYRIMEKREFGEVIKSKKGEM